MHKRLFFLLCVVIVLCSSQVSARLGIGIIGDQTETTNLKQAYRTLAEACRTLAEYEPDLVLHVGDIVESAKDNAEIKADFEQAVSYLNSMTRPLPLIRGSETQFQTENRGNEHQRRQCPPGPWLRPIPWFITAGDHDVDPPGDYTPGTKNVEKRELFHDLLKNEYLSRNRPLALNHLYYSFDFREYHFICLFSLDNLRTDPRWGNVFMNKILEEQFQWLKQDLATTWSDDIVVFVHQPMWYNWTGWKRVHNLLKEYPVRAVIAGHFHYNQDEGFLDGIRYLVVGSSGGAIKNASENAGGLHHVTLLTLEEQSMSLKLIPLQGYKQKEFSRRINMDRIEAIDTMLGSIEYADPQHPLTTRANPTDIPVSIYAYEGEDEWNLLYDKVEPGTGVIISNTSSVYLEKAEKRHSLKGMKIMFTDESGLEFWDSMIFDDDSSGSTIKR